MAIIDPIVLNKANQWLDNNFDEDTRTQVRNMIDHEPALLVDAFYRSLEFGTGGMRGKMGPGMNRMNVYTIGMATQGLANYLKKMFTELPVIRVVVSYDSRINNKLFAGTVANVLSANGIQVYVFESLRPTPELSFAIRQMCCQSGIMVTASHNPKEYNGYKVYWDDGGQLVPPHDHNVITEVGKITTINDVKFEGNNDLIEYIGEYMDDLFLSEVKNLLFLPSLSTKDKIRIVYTPLHGTGGRLIPKALQSFGYTNLHLVEEQMIEDGNFPTAKSPNPEEAVALELALKKARLVNADLVLATDPDADRVGVAIKNDKEEYVLLNGNQTGALLMDYVLGKWQKSEKIKENNFVVTTIVTSEIMKAIADAYNVKIYDVLTGFKWIADVVRVLEGKEKYIIGLEESYGYMISDFVRDKDSVSASVLISEMAAEAASEGSGLFDRLLDVYQKYGFYKEGLISISKEGKSGAEEISKMMSDYRQNPPTEIDHKKVIRIMDYDELISKDILTGKTTVIDLPASNVLQFFTEDGSKISVRPSGTEPKIKFYFSVKEHLQSKKEYEKVNLQLDEKINSMIKSLGLR